MDEGVEGGSQLVVDVSFFAPRRRLMGKVGARTSSSLATKQGC